MQSKTLLAQYKNLSLTPSRMAVLVLASGLLGLTLSGCETGSGGLGLFGGGSSGTPSSTPGALGCTQEIVRVLSPLKQDGRPQVNFNWRDLMVFLDGSVRITEVNLLLALKGKYKGTSDEVSLSVNGFQAYGSDGSPFYEFRGYSSERDSSSSAFKLHKMKLNGAEPIESLILRILFSHGDFELSPHGKDIRIQDASVEIKGISNAACPSPSPSPSISPSPGPSTRPRRWRN